MNETLYMIVGLILILSIGLNVFLIWYCRNILRRMIFDKASEELFEEVNDDDAATTAPQIAHPG